MSIGFVDSVNANPRMTVEEFGTLIGYRSVQKLNLDTFKELLDQSKGTMFEVIVKVDIYRNKSTLDYVDYVSFLKEEIEPHKPDKTLIISKQWVHEFFDENREITFSYALSEDNSIPGYK